MQRIGKNTLPIIFVLFVFSAWLAYQIWQNIPPFVTPDTARQLGEGISEVYYNWKPTIYSWILGCFETCFPQQGLICALIFQLLLLGGGVVAISLYYARKNPRYALLILILPLFFTVKGMLVQVVGNDATAAGCYLAFIGTWLWGITFKNKAARIITLAVSIALLGIGMALRHNAIPAVLLLAFWGFLKWGERPFKSFFCALITCIILLAANHIITYQLLRAEPSYPLKSPLADDLVNLSIVNGKWSDFCLQQGADKLLPPHEQFYLCPQVANAGKPINPYLIPPDKEQRKQIYEEMQAAWWKEVRTHPGKYLAIKLFFYHQHLLEGRCSPALCRLFRSFYPHVRIHMEKESQQLSAWVNREFIVMTVIPLISFVITIASVFYIRRRNWSKIPEPTKDALFFMTAALLYCATFILLVLAATEQRYYIIRASLSCMGLALFILSLWCSKSQKELP